MNLTPITIQDLAATEGGKFFVRVDESGGGKIELRDGEGPPRYTLGEDGTATVINPGGDPELSRGDLYRPQPEDIVFKFEM